MYLLLEHHNPKQWWESTATIHAKLVIHMLYLEFVLAVILHLLQKHKMCLVIHCIKKLNPDLFRIINVYVNLYVHNLILIWMSKRMIAFIRLLLKHWIPVGINAVLLRNVRMIHILINVLKLQILVQHIKDKVMVIIL